MSRKPLARRPTLRLLRNGGFTLVEVLVSIVVISVGLVGTLKAFEMAASRSADPLVDKQLLSIAEGMMEEIMLQPYVPAPNATPVGCARDTFNDVSDYAGYATTNQICASNGTPVPTLAGYSVSVSQTSGTLYGAPFKRTVVTASRGSRSLALTAYKSDLS